MARCFRVRLQIEATLTRVSGALDPRTRTMLVEALLEEAESHCVPCVCLFTRIPGFFQRFGFVQVDRTALPDKIYKDCANCPRLNACDEFAMARGTLPDIAVLGPVRVEEHLVPLQI